MRRVIILVVLLFAVTVALAATLTVTVPPGSASSNAVDQCERLRVQLQIRATDYNNDLCATLMAREAVELLTVQELNQTYSTSVNSCTSTAEATRQAGLSQFETDWPLPVTPAECGDSIADTEFGEDCDDGGESATCDPDCSSVVCGDRYVNTTAGEQCDDGNTDPGDGCDATCQLE